MRPYAARKKPQIRTDKLPIRASYGPKLLVRQYSPKPAISHIKMEFRRDSPTLPLCLDAEERISTPYSQAKLYMVSGPQTSSKVMPIPRASNPLDTVVRAKVEAAASFWLPASRFRLNHELGCRLDDSNGNG